MDDYIFGVRAVIEAIKAGKEIEKVLVKRGAKSELMKELHYYLKDNQVPFQYVPIEKINSITRKNHQGVVAWISPIEYQNIENVLPMVFEAGRTPLFLILDKITDIRNFGSIARTAECTGVDAIIVHTKKKAMLNADAIKTSAGALHKIPVCRVADLKETITFLKNSGIHIVAATEKTNNLIYDADFTQPIAIIMGAEDKGIAPEYLKLADKLIKIPMTGTIESLNVAVAAGVILYEGIRQRPMK